MRRFLFVTVLVLIIGGIFAAVYLVRPVTLTAAQITEIKSNCQTCHSVPVSFGEEENIHSLHRSVECSVCHQGSSRGEEEETVSSSVCVACHSQPVYSSAKHMHDAHSTTECSACHTETAELLKINHTHNILKWVSISLVIALISGLLLNYIVARIRLAHRDKKR